MKVVILAGGKGSRISYYTHKIPKPMIRIGNKPILAHIMDHFQSYGYDDFLIAAGYKKKVIDDYFLKSKKYKKLEIINTGDKTETGGRILKLKKYLKKNENFFMTYGDGVSNINLKKLLKFHNLKKKIATVTAVRPPVKFGEIYVGSDNIVKSFKEKPNLNSGWINGGFFILNEKIFDYIHNDKVIFERDPLIKLAKKKQLVAYKHQSFWRCMDNLKEKEYLENLYIRNKSIWKIN